MKCVVHIGTSKTGTTLVQKWLYKNKTELSNQGIFLSDILGKENNRLMAAFFQSRLDDWTKRTKINTLAQKNEYFDGFLDKVRDEIRRAAKSHKTFVITSEHFHSRLKRKDIAELSKFLRENFDDVTIVCYFRNQFDMAVSRYSTAIKAGSKVNLQDFIKSIGQSDYLYNFLNVANNWASEFGQEHCKFRIYDRENFLDRDIRKDFATLINENIDLEKLNYTIESSNESLSALQASAFRAVNHSIPLLDSSRGGVDRTNKKIKLALTRVESLKNSHAQIDLRTEIESQFAPSNTEFFRKYFSRENQFQSDESVSVAGQTYSPAEAQALILDTIREILVALQKNTKNNDNLDRQRISLEEVQGALFDAITETLSALKKAERDTIAKPSGQAPTKPQKTLL